MKKKIIEFLKKNKKYIVYSLFIAFGAFITISTIRDVQQSNEVESIDEILYTEFQELVKDGKVDTIYYNTGVEDMVVVLFNEETINMSEEERKDYVYDVKDKRIVPYPKYDDFRKEMLEAEVNLEVLDTDNNTLVNILDLALSLAFPILYIVLLVKLMSSNKGMDKDSIMQTSTVKFSDVIGQDEILDDIKFISELIKNPSRGDDIGVKCPKGVLLSGEPGTGKTLIAKAIAGEAGVPFISVGGSDFKELFVGMGAKRVRETFQIAREHAPCVIFIDEIDSVGAKRDSRGSSSEDDQTINALLKEMDGFSGREGIFVIAATNRPDKLDSALVRAGRFDRQIIVNRPRDWKVRRDLFNHYLKNYKLDESVDIETLSKQCSGFTGADISTICNEAGIIAVMHDKTCIDNACMEEAIDKKVFKGNRSKSEQFKSDKNIVAYHEAGHAIASYLLGHEISRASIIATTSGVGGAVFNAETDSVFVTDKELRERVMVAYAGRASEEIKYKVVTTGASNDISQATSIMIQYIEHYGFDKEFGLLDMSILNNQHILDNSDITNRLSKMSSDLYADTVKLLSDNYDKVESLARKLLEVETLSGDEIKKLLEG